MGDPSGSMLYIVLILGGVYIVGMGLYTLVQYIRKKIASRRDD